MSWETSDPDLVSAMIAFLTTVSKTMVMLRLGPEGEILATNPAFAELFPTLKRENGLNVQALFECCDDRPDRSLPMTLVTYRVLGGAVPGATIRGIRVPTGEGSVLIGERLPPALAETLNLLSANTNEIARMEREAQRNYRGSKRAQTYLEFRYKALIKSTDQGMVWFDAEGRVLETNPAAMHILGQRDFSRIQQELLNAIGENGRAFTSGSHPVFHALRSGQPQIGVTLGLRGGATWILLDALPDQSSGEVGPPLVCATFTDITERRQAEKALTESLQELLESKASLQLMADRLSLAAQAGGVGIWDWDVGGNRLLWDGQMYRLYGIEADQFSGAYEAWRSGLHPDDAVRGDAEIQAALSGEKDFDTEFRVVWPDGSVRFIQALALVQRDASGVPIRMIGTNWDITERKQSEAALQESEARWKFAIEGAGDGLWDWNVQTGKAYYSPRYKEMLGYADADIGTTSDEWIKRIHPDDAPGAFAGLQPYLEGKPGCATVEFRMLCKDGSWRWIQGRGLVVASDAEGKPMRMIGTNTDITERKLAEEEKRKLQAQLQQSQKMESLGTLAGGVAHDMNNVLGAILGLASAHIGGLPYGSPLHRSLDTICKAAERGGQMVKSLLSFARQSTSEFRSLDLNTILRDESSLLERTTLAKISIHMDLAANLRPIQGDASALTHAIMNLCVNAVDAMPENGHLTLRTRNVDEDWIEVVVEDSGTGMPKDILDKALDPFFTTKDVGKGTGLGLSMVYSTVKAHLGQMQIESEPGQGTRVMMRFPSCEDEPPAQADSKPMESVPSRRVMSVLLVDDDELIHSSMQMIFEVMGHTVQTAQSGEEALAMLESGLEPDLVILDMNMPGLGGAGTLPRLRGLNPGVPVLLSTGRADESALSLASGYPYVTLLPKPYSLRELQKQLGNLGLG